MRICQTKSSIKRLINRITKWIGLNSAHQAIFEYIEVFYNRQRKHSTNGYLAPLKYEKQLAGAA